MLSRLQDTQQGHVSSTTDVRAAQAQVAVELSKSGLLEELATQLHAAHRAGNTFQKRFRDWAAQLVSQDWCSDAARLATFQPLPLPTAVLA